MPGTTMSSRPSLAERARSVLAASTSATIVTSDAEHDVSAVAADGSGDVLLRLGSGHPLTQAALSADGGDLTAVVELTQLSAVPARDRVRSRLSLGGWLAAEPLCGPDADGVRLRLDVVEVVLEDVDGAWEVEVEDYRAAAPDCLVHVESEHLLHLADQHPDAVTLLARLAGRRVLQDAVRVLPLGLDRYGLVLRIERVRGHVDVRLPFPAPASRAEDVSDAMRRLLTLAAQHPSCGRLSTS